MHQPQSMKPRKILCPTDFSAGSQHALSVAVRLARGSNAELVILHSWYVPPSAFPTEMSYPPSLLQSVQDDARDGLDAAMRDALADGAPRVTTVLSSGPAWAVITDAAAADPEIDLIVIATHGRTGLARFLVGSVAEKVIRHAPCSVLAVQPTAPLRPFRHILCPVDFSESSHAALELAGALGQHDDALVEVLHVIEIPARYSGELPAPEFARTLDANAATRLDQWCAELAQRYRVPIKAHTRIGYPGAETLAVIDKDRTIDLVVMGSRGRTGIRRALLGSVAEKVARHAGCPVLVSRSRSA